MPDVNSNVVKIEALSQKGKPGITVFQDENVPVGK